MSLTYVDYQQGAMRTAIYPEIAQIQYPAMKLAGEVGEVAGQLVLLRATPTTANASDARLDVVKALHAELGDVLWYTAALLRDLGLHAPLGAPWMHEPLRTLEARALGLWPARDDEAALADGVLSLAAVATEPAETYGKLIRDRGLTRPDEVPEGAREKLLHSVHQSVLLVAVCARRGGTSLEQVAEANLAKLASRQKRGVLTGSGDAR